jgi:UDP:flavonoid glycosyltransferase YjiC (YdhE family)
LPDLPPGLRAVYTDADHVLYADVPELFPMQALPDTHQFIGPILWEPPVSLPPWWADVPTNQPWAYVTMGSSGHTRVLETVLAAMGDLPVTTLAASASDWMPASVPANALVAKYLPGTEVARRSAVVVCNGGSLTCQQALAAGVPVLGIASNMDQFMNMEALVRSGAGILLRADRLSQPTVRAAVQRLLADPAHGQAARAAAAHLHARDAGEAFGRFVHAQIG